MIFYYLVKDKDTKREFIVSLEGFSGKRRDKCIKGTLGQAFAKSRNSFLCKQVGSKNKVNIKIIWKTRRTRELIFQGGCSFRIDGKGGVFEV